MIRKLQIIIFLISVINFFIVGKEIKIKVIDKELLTPIEGVCATISTGVGKYYSNSDGFISIQANDEVIKSIIYLYLIGYSQKKVLITKFDEEVVVSLSIEGLLSGKELIVEGKHFENDQKIGNSVVIDKEELKPLSMKGMVEDVISAIKTMPGVTYSSNSAAELSVRGGRLDEVTTTLDGFIVRCPYYWYGRYSIFNPNIADYVKFSNGIFSAKNGMAMSGLVEVFT
ncbi:MAG TPA: Plug domain-containing protein, partial [Spirochaetota bacterium]|nr:Plug domain-containing protein [Spirochaetota bacterium]